MVRSYFTHDNWLDDQAAKGVPVLSDCYVEDLRTLNLAYWDVRNCNTAFVRFTNMEGVTEARVQEIPAGASLDPFKLGVEEMVYVLAGRGFASVWGEISNAKRDFEWSDRSVFVIPRNSWCELRNMGNTPVRLLFFNYLPIALSTIPDPEFFMNNPHVNKSILDDADQDFFSEAKDIEKDFGSAWGSVGSTVWRGNFWPDLLAWDKLTAAGSRGAGGSSIAMYVPGSEISAHMSVFPPGTYKKGHRHGPGRVIVIPAGEGYSIMWPEGGEKVIAPWHEGSMFTPPDRWFHQHFNVSVEPARYLALAPLPQFSGHSEKVEDRRRDQIEYPYEESWIREKFEEELDKRGLESLMPHEAYTNPDFKWGYRSDEEQGAVLGLQHNR
jgi:quercetin dioxygenase-like cupin family protein